MDGGVITNYNNKLYVERILKIKYNTALTTYWLVYNLLSNIISMCLCNMVYFVFTYVL